VPASHCKFVIILLISSGSNDNEINFAVCVIISTLDSWENISLPKRRVEILESELKAWKILSKEIIRFKL
jgi:hypothetical protein